MLVAFEASMCEQLKRRLSLAKYHEMHLKGLLQIIYYTRMLSNSPTEQAELSETFIMT